MTVIIDDEDSLTDSYELSSDYGLKKGDEIVFYEEIFFEKRYKIKKRVLLLDANKKPETLFLKVKLLKNKN